MGTCPGDWADPTQIVVCLEGFDGTEEEQLLSCARLVRTAALGAGARSFPSRGWTRCDETPKWVGFLVAFHNIFQPLYVTYAGLLMANDPRGVTLAVLAGSATDDDDEMEIPVPAAIEDVEAKEGDGELGRPSEETETVPRPSCSDGGRSRSSGWSRHRRGCQAGGSSVVETHHYGLDQIRHDCIGHVLHGFVDARSHDISKRLLVRGRQTLG